jgi:hypothetical protein
MPLPDDFTKGLPDDFSKGFSDDFTKSLPEKQFTPNVPLTYEEQIAGGSKLLQNFTGVPAEYWNPENYKPTKNPLQDLKKVGLSTWLGMGALYEPVERVVHYTTAGTAHRWLQEGKPLLQSIWDSTASMRKAELTPEERFTWFDVMNQYHKDLNKQYGLPEDYVAPLDKPAEFIGGLAARFLMPDIASMGLRAARKTAIGTVSVAKMTAKEAFDTVKLGRDATIEQADNVVRWLQENAKYGKWVKECKALYSPEEAKNIIKAGEEILNIVNKTKLSRGGSYGTSIAPKIIPGVQSEVSLPSKTLGQVIYETSRLKSPVSTPQEIIPGKPGVSGMDVDIAGKRFTSPSIPGTPTITKGGGVPLGKVDLTKFFTPSGISKATLPNIMEQDLTRGTASISTPEGVTTIQIPGYENWVREESTALATKAFDDLALKTATGKEVKFIELPAITRAEVLAEVQKSMLSKDLSQEDRKKIVTDTLRDKLQANNFYWVGSERPVSGDTPLFFPMFNQSFPMKELADKLRHGVEYVVNGVKVRESIRPDQWKIHVGNLEIQKPGIAEKVRNILTDLYKKSTIPESIPPEDIDMQPFTMNPLSPDEQQFIQNKIAEGVPADQIKSEMLGEKRFTVDYEGMKPYLPGESKEKELDAKGKEVHVIKQGENQYEVRIGLKGSFDYMVPLGSAVISEGEVISATPEPIETTKDNNLKVEMLREDVRNAKTPEELRTAFEALNKETEASQEDGEFNQQVEDLRGPTERNLEAKAPNAIPDKVSFFTGDLVETSKDLETIKQYYDLTLDWKQAVEASNVTKAYDDKIKALQMRLNQRRKKLDRVTGQTVFVRKYNANNIFNEITRLEQMKKKVLDGYKLTKEDLDKVNELYSREAEDIISQMTPEMQDLVRTNSPEKLTDIIQKLQHNLWVSKTAKEKIQAEDEENPEPQDIETVTPPEEGYVDVDIKGTVLDVPLEEGEENVTTYNETLNETTVFTVECSGVNVEDINGVPVFLKGNFAVVKDPYRTDVKLVNKEKGVWVSKEQIRELISKSEFVKVLMKKIADRRGSIFNPASVAQQMARSFYNMFKPLKDKPEKVNTFVKQDYPLKRFLETFQFIGSDAGFLEHLAARVPELRQYIKGPQTPKETIPNLMVDRRFRPMADYYAGTSVKTAIKMIYDKASQEIQKRNPDANAGQVKKAAQEEVGFIKWLMFRAGEEVKVPFGSNTKIPGLLFYSLTELGIRGPWAPSENPLTPDGERTANVRDLVQAYRRLGIPISKALAQSWAKERPRLAFFSLLSHPNLVSDDTYQRLLVWGKTELDNPLLADMIKSGMFAHSDMFAMYMRGFQKRPWQKDELDKMKGDYGQVTLGSKDVQPQKYRTNAEFAMQTKNKGLVPIDDWQSSEMTYIKDSLLLLAQVRLLNRYKVLRNPNPTRLQGFEDNAEITKLISYVPLVAYEITPTVRKICDIAKITPNDFFTRMNYLQAKNLPGFALYMSGSGDRFQPPYIISELYHVFMNMYSVGTFSNLAHTLSALQYPIKLIQTIAPLDSTMRYLDPSFVRRPHSVISTQLQMFWQGLIGGPFIGAQILMGKYDPMAKWSSEKYEDLPRYLAHGFPRHMSDFLQSQFDINYGQKIIPELNTTVDNVKEFAISMGGFTIAMLDRIVLPKLYDVVKALDQDYQTKGDDPDTAARKAVTKVNNLSGLLDRNIWGPEGSAVSALLYSRGLTPAFIRSFMIGVVRPIITAKPWRKYGKRLWRGAFGYKAKPPLSWLNAFFAADIGENDLDDLQYDVLKYILKYLLISYGVGNAIQWSLSWKDPKSKEDPNPLASWRFMWGNDRKHWWNSKLPWKDVNSNDVYLNQQMFVNAAMGANVILNFAGKLLYNDPRWGKSPMDVMRSKLSVLFGLTSALITKRDPRTGEFIVTPNASPELQNDQFMNWSKDYVRPFQVSKQQHTPLEKEGGGELAQKVFNASKWFGIDISSGAMSEEGYESNEVSDLLRDIANDQVLQKDESEKLKDLSAEELIDLDPSIYLSPETLINAAKKKKYPISTLIMRNKRALQRQEFIRGEKESGLPADFKKISNNP